MGLSSSSQGVWFPQWAEVLARVRLKDLERRAYRSAIMDYLGFCKRSRQQATVESARKFMEQVEARRRLGVSQLATWKTGLNWFFRAAKSSTLKPGMAHTSQRATPCVRAKEPPLAATDLGGPEWERKLIRELRSRHYEWRTEQAYRMWARRFAEWLEKRRGASVPSAGEIELRDFLSDLATQQRVAVATQRQALNAVVLSQEDVGRLLAALEGTWRLLAQVLYGTGMRLMECLRLRIKDVDFERNQIMVHGGKGRVNRFAPRGF